MCIHPSCNCFAPFSHISSKCSDNADCIVLCNNVTNLAIDIIFFFARVNLEKCLASLDSTHDSQQNHVDQKMILCFDERGGGPYREYPSCRSQPVTILGQSMNPHAEVSGEGTKLQRQEETWKVALED